MHEKATHLAGFLIGESNFVMMLFPEKTFKGFTGNEISDTHKRTEVLINIDAQSGEEVDAIAETVHKTGGQIYAEPGESQEWVCPRF